jgi:hypothetical protein
MIEESDGCQKYPPSVINALVGIISFLAIATISLGGYYVYANKQNENKRTAEEAKDFDAIVENPIAAENPQ